jgi:hypothetical protein
MGAPNSEVGYTSDSTRKGAHTKSIWICGGIGGGFTLYIIKDMVKFKRPTSVLKGKITAYIYGTSNVSYCYIYADT